MTLAADILLKKENLQLILAIRI